MKIISYNTGHDGHVCYVNNDELIFSHEMEKNNHPRYSKNSLKHLASCFTAPSTGFDIVAVSGWAVGNDPRNAPTDGGYLGLEYSVDDTRGISWVHCSHELSHIICTYALSPFADREDCYVLLWEGFIGRFYHISTDLKVELLEDICESPGLRYSFAFAIADPSFNLPRGYCRLGDAGKMMALAAYGRSTENSAEENALLDYLLNTSSPTDTFNKSDLCYSPLYNIGVDTQEFCDFAKKVSDGIYAHFFESIERLATAKKPLLIAGGCGLNCDWNRRWEDCKLFSDVFIPPCTNDTGVAIGAAALAKKIFVGTSELRWTVYSGPEFNDSCSSELSPAYQQHPLSLELICDKLFDGELICWVQGRCEIGPRALGNRSILGEPFNRCTTDKINKVKNREHYRPVAPICLEEDAPLHFEQCTQSKFMLSFHRVKNPKLRAITHIDGTARVQTLTRSDNAATYDLLRQFKKISGVGVLCNTSLNFNGAGFINNIHDLELFCLQKKIGTFVVNNTMYCKQGDF